MVIVIRARAWALSALVLLSLWGCAAPTTPDSATEDGEEKPLTELRLADFQPGEVSLKEADSKIFLYAHPEDDTVSVVTYSISRPDNDDAILIESNEKDYAYRLELPRRRFYPGIYSIKLYSDLDRLEPFKELEYNHIDPDFYD